MKLTIFAESNVWTGLGHLMRCMALALAWEAAGGDCMIGMQDCPEEVRTRFASEHIRFITLKPEDTEKNALKDLRMAVGGPKQGNNWIVMDGYHFSREALDEAKSAFGRLLVMHDGNEAPTGSPDLLVNANWGDVSADYQSLGPETKLLLGPRYALLRKEFRQQDTSQLVPAIASQARRILLTLGGSDPIAATAPLAEALAAIKDVRITVLVGPMNPRYAALTSLAAKYESVEIQRDPADLATLMRKHDLAVCAAGTTTWELAALGVPTILIAAAENQEAIAKNMHRIKAAVSLGTWDEKLTPARCREAVEALAGSPTQRAVMRDRARALVDGQGARRIVDSLRFSDWNIIPVRAEDREEIWKLANESTIRRESLTQDPIPWDTHVKWFARALVEDRFLILRDPGGRFCGEARIGKKDGEQIFSIGLVPDIRGHGLGTYLIENLSEGFLRDHPSETLVAYIRKDNGPSLLAFQKAGYRREGAALQEDVFRLCLHSIHNDATDSHWRA